MRHLKSLSLTLALIGTVAAGDIYCDPHGHDCTDRPTPGWTLVRSDMPRRPDDNATPAPTSSQPTPKPPAGSSASDQIQQQKARQSMQSDLAAKRAEQCKQAQDRYQKDIQYRRLYRVDSSGQQTYLTDEEADNERTQAKIDVDQYCGAGASSANN
jgi:hypothetical protein